MGRDFVFDAYFTGKIPDTIFNFLVTAGRRGNNAASQLMRKEQIAT